MTSLNIYSLDDTTEDHVIACLPEGKHLIGRGDLLQVTDKRVSRKHAQIEVSSNQILLTSVHVNPCFLKAANGKTLSVLSQHQQSELNDGDKFALLPETCWFRVKITREQAISGSLNGLNNSTAELNGKRHHDNNFEEENSDSESKRARLSTSTTSDNTTTDNVDNSATTSNNTSDITNNVKNEAAFLHQKDQELDKPPEERNAEEINKSLNVAETDGIQNENEGVNMEIKEEPKEDEGDASTSNNVLASSSNNDLNITANAIIKEEPLNDSNKEGNTGENGIPMQNNDVPNDQPAEVKTENEDNSENKDGASGSGTDPKKVPRERCWYGAQCFRKNPIHRESFTHPGDEDYESDADDNRPDCPYGTSCYRKNMEHRRDYKHTGKPAPKPRPRSTSPNSPVSPTVQNQPPNQKKRRRVTAKKAKPQDYNIDSSQDDYDMDDPFINDASSDDFQPSDDSGSDSDWEDSQEVDEESQERKRLLKEAKKFTRKGKKK